MSPTPTFSSGTGTDGDVVVVGDLMVDVVATVDAPIEFGSDTPATVIQRGGGSAANTAAWLGDLGVPTRLVAAVGDDAVGASARDELDQHGVVFVGAVVPDTRTGTCVVIVDESRERTMFPDRGANAALDTVDLDVVRRHLPFHVHVSGYALLADGSRDAALACLDWAREVGAGTSVDAASAGPLTAVGADRFLGWVEGVDELMANDDEVAALGGVPQVLRHVRFVLAKHGRHGATWTDGTREHRVDAVPVDAVDSTGAGDSFAAGWIAARRRGAAVAEALEAAASVAARAVTQVGARPPLPG